MTDHRYSQVTSLHSSENILGERSVMKPRHVRFARIVSNILAPVTISLPFVVLVAFYHTRNQLAAIVYAFITLFFLSIGPLIYVVIGVRTGKLSDLHGSRRWELSGP